MQSVPLSGQTFVKEIIWAYIPWCLPFPNLSLCCLPKYNHSSLDPSIVPSKIFCGNKMIVANKNRPKVYQYSKAGGRPALRNPAQKVPLNCMSSPEIPCKLGLNDRVKYSVVKSKHCISNMLHLWKIARSWSSRLKCICSFNKDRFDKDPLNIDY